MAKNTKNTKTTAHINMKLITLGIVTLVILAGVYMFQKTVFKNHAETEAKAIEAALIKGGAVKKCTYGDPGIGPDNAEPWYEARFVIAENKADTIRLMQSAARAGGFNFQKTGNPYPSIESYSDNIGRPSNVPGYNNGNITASAQLYSDSNEKALYCGSSPIKADANHTAISFGLSLPAATQK